MLSVLFMHRYLDRNRLIFLDEMSKLFKAKSLTKLSGCGNLL